MALKIHLLAHSCKPLIARDSLWRWGIGKFDFLQGPEKIGKSVSKACGIVASTNLIFTRTRKLGKSDSKACGIEDSLACPLLQTFNSARFLVALRHWQIWFFARTRKDRKIRFKSLWRCGIAKFGFCKELKVREIQFKCLWHSLACQDLWIFNSAQFFVALWHWQICFLQVTKT